MTQNNKANIEIDNDLDNKIKVPDYAFTHAGKFHSDDVFSSALLTYLNPDIKITRGYVIPEDFKGVVFDIGGGKYDHHQKDALIRDNGIPYAAFGLLWKEFGTLILSEEDAKNFDKSFVQPLDYSDNTGASNEMAELISLFNPNWDEDLDYDVCFNEAKEIALAILTKKFNFIKSLNRAENFVKEAVENAQDNILVLAKRAPWKHFTDGTDIEFVVYPSARGGYNAQGVPMSMGSADLKISFPKEWRGKTADELKAISGVETLSFCHNSGFLISAGTIEDTIKACKLARNQEQ